ncbi:MAG: peptidase domain-containing ABC transporter [Bacillota bacterium]|nr:peptidase domain-containing ABC transporter [Bacillota bacterium]
MKKRVPVVIQMHTGENAAAILGMMLGYFGKHVPLKTLRESCVFSRSGTSPAQLCASAGKFGLEAECVELSMDELIRKLRSRECSLPVVAGWRRKYYVIIRKIRGRNIHLTDASRGEHVISLEKFATLYRGFLLPMQPGADFVPDGKPVYLSSLIHNRIRGNGRSVARAVVLNGLAIFANLALLHLNTRMLDEVIGQNQSHLFWPVVLGMLLCALLNLIFSAVRTISVFSAGRQMAARSGSGLFKKLICLPLSFFEQNSAGELLERLEKNSGLDYSLMQNLLPRIVNLVQTALYIVMLFLYSSPLATACLCLELLYILMTNWLQQRLAIISRSITVSSGRMNASSLNGLSTVETIKSTGSEDSFFRIWRRNQRDYHDNRKAALGLQSLISSVSGIHTAITSALLLFGGVYFIINGNFTIGMLSVFQSMWEAVRGEFSSCMDTLSSFQSMRTNIERVDDILERETRQPVPLRADQEPDKLRGSVSIRDLCFRYNPGDPLVVDHISLDVQPGQIVALVGSTGCGKSTLVKLIADLYRAEEGCILYDGLRREEIPDAVFHSSIAAVDQEITVFCDSVKNNITMWDQTVENYELILSMRDAHIYERVIRDPDGIYAQIREKGRNFSGGELQRIELARALCQEPTLILLDEFTSALDAKTEERIFSFIRERGVTVIIVAHRLSTVSNCDHVFVLEQGRIVEQGAPAELYAAKGRYFELVRAQ